MQCLVKENCDLKEGSRQEREPLLEDGLMLRAQMPCHMQKREGMVVGRWQGERGRTPLRSSLVQSLCHWASRIEREREREGIAP